MDLLVQQPAFTPIQHPVQTAMPDNDAELSSYLNTQLDALYDSRWLIVAIALAFTLIGVAYVFMAKPVYEASMLIQVEEEGKKESRNILGDMASIFAVKTSAISEMELLHSRLVVSRAIDNLRLYIEVRPKYFPVIGAWLADQNKQLSSPGLLGYGGYAWGAEKIDVGSFNVSNALLNHDFSVTAEGNGQFRLTEEKSGIDLRGTIGTLLYADTPKGTIELRIDRIHAKPGTQFSLKRTSRLSLIENAQNLMAMAEKGKQSGMIGVTFQGDDPQIASAILSEIGREYMRQNAVRKTEEAEKSLAYLSKQLPDLKQQLERAEAKYNQFRNTHGTVDLSEEAKLSLQQSSAVKMKGIDLMQRRTALLTRFTSEHPAVRGIDSQLKEIYGEIQSMADHIKSLPMIEQDAVRLARDVKVNEDLYTALLNTAQQLRMITAGKASNVRMVDTPLSPEKPVLPDRPMVIAIAVLIGLMLGVIVAFVKKTFHGSIDDPVEIEQMLDVPVYATIPHSRKQKELYEQVGAKSPKMPLLAKASPSDIAIESLRNFRPALQFSMNSSQNNIVLITGPTEGMGKTFVSANLAAIMAVPGQRVVLIDADFRNGYLHRYFGLSRQGGLSDCISGTRRVEQVIHRGVMESMDFLSTGSIPPNPSEMLLHPNFGALLQSLSASYDLVLIDATPILAVADSLIIGAHAGAIYITTRAGVTTAGEIMESIKRMNQAGLSVKGLLFNDSKLAPGRYGYGYKYGKINQQVSSGSQPLLEATG